MLNRFERFIVNITEIDLYWHRLATSVMKEYGLKGNYSVYFPILSRNSEGLTAAQLSTICGRDKADVSRDISALEKKGLVTRMRAGESTYRAKIMLTEEGHVLSGKILAVVETAVDCIGGELDSDERDCFYRALEVITRNMKTLSETGIPTNN